MTRASSTPRDWARYLVAVPLALLAHVAYLGLVVGSSMLHPSARPTPKKAPQQVSFRTIDARQWSTNRGRTAPREERPAPTHPQGQVVDVAPGNHQRAPDAKYLAETDNRVSKETRAREQTNKYSVATAKNTAHPELMPVARGHAGGQTPQPAQSQFLKNFVGDGPQRLSLLPQPEVVGREGPREPTEQQGLADGTANAARSSDATESGGGAPNDDLRDVAAGESTALNTREWKYAGFFNRVKQAVSARWDPNRKLDAHGAKEVGYADRTTVLHVTLRPDGSLAEAYVARSSGLDWLDQEAVHAFEHAQPFPNPPTALVENGFIRFTFGFNITHDGMDLPGLLRLR